MRSSGDTQRQRYRGIWEVRILRSPFFPILVVAAVLTAGSLIPTHQVVRATCILSPRAVWTLSEPAPGRLESRATDTLTGETLQYRLFQFERSSFVSLELTDETRERWEDVCPAGTVVARVGSSDLDLEIAERLSALDRARAHLEALRAGSKPANVEVAALAVEQARAALAVYEPELARVRSLHAQGLATDEDLEVAEGTWRIRTLDVELARAQQRAVEAGARPAKIAEAEVAVGNIETELRALAAKSSATLIAPPITGRLCLAGTVAGPGATGPVLASVASDDTMTVQILVDQRERERVREGQRVLVRIPGLDGRNAEGRVAYIERTHRPLARQQIFVVRALVPNPGHHLEAGMRGNARIVGERRTFLAGWLEEARRLLRREGALTTGLVAG